MSKKKKSRPDQAVRDAAAKRLQKVHRELGKHGLTRKQASKKARRESAIDTLDKLEKRLKSSHLWAETFYQKSKEPGEKADGWIEGVKKYIEKSRKMCREWADKRPGIPRLPTWSDDCNAHPYHIERLIAWIYECRNLEKNPNAPLADPVSIPWLRRVVPQKKVKGDSSKLAGWLKRKGVHLCKIAGRYYAERSDLLRLFRGGSSVNEAIKDHEKETE